MTKIHKLPDLVGPKEDPHDDVKVPTPGPFVAIETNEGWYVKSETVPGYFIHVRLVRSGQDVEADAHRIADALNIAFSQKDKTAMDYAEYLSARRAKDGAA